MNKRRLLKLADLLEADAENEKGVRFDLSAWARKDDGEGYFSMYGFSAKEVVPVNCNTAACAWGLAAISGAFKRQGVGYHIYPSSGVLVPTYKDKTEIHAAEDFFKISEEEAWFLFDPDEYPERKRTGAAGERFVAKRIRDFVAGKVGPS
jgi:hypothetical protein